MPAGHTRHSAANTRPYCAVELVALLTLYSEMPIPADYVQNLVRMPEHSNFLEEI